MSDKKDILEQAKSIVGIESCGGSKAIHESFKGISDVEKSFSNASSFSGQTQPQDSTSSPSSGGASSMMPDITPQKKN
ncbi:hypothetical protein [Aeromonas veronii]|uniref:hypothetical protein n=1 Tax=Aeromonas veronii TaxID=654 RepID=UPI0038D2A9BF